MPDWVPTAEPEVATRGQQRLAQLLLSAREGRRESLEQIVAELSPLLWHVVRAQGLDRERTQDVVQHTWLQLLSRLDEIRSPLALTGWLVTTAKREAWRVQTAQRMETLVESSEMVDMPDPLPTPEDGVLLGERHLAVWRAVRQLPPRCRELLRVVAFVRRPDYGEVAAALGMPRGSIGPTRGRCLAKLRALLEAEPERSRV